MLSIIVVTAKNLAIGKENRLLWHLSEDLKYFRRTTTGHSVIMGYNTFLSVNKRPLPNRRNIVVNNEMKDGVYDGVEFFSTLEGAIAASGAGNGGEEVFIIGGGMMYRTSMPLAQKLYITEVSDTVEDADTFFPEIDLSIWKEETRSEPIKDEKAGVEYSFVTYIRK